MPPDVLPLPPILVNEMGLIAGNLPCKGCSYNLRGLPIDSRCPTCATKIAISLEGEVAGDVPCRGCSYNLRGLPLDSKCPECATEVAISLQGNLLRYSHPRWLNRLTLGATLIACALLMDAFIASPVEAKLGSMQRSIVFTWSLLAVCGTWLLTTPDPAGQEERWVVRARRIARLGMALVVMRSITSFFIESMPAEMGGLVGFGFVIAAVARVAGEFAQLYYLRKIVLRIPDERMASAMGLLCFFFLPSIAGVTILNSFITFILLASKSSPSWLASNFYFMNWSVIVARVYLMMTAILYAFMMVNLVVKLRMEKKTARSLRAAARADGHETSSVDLSASGRGGGASGS